jgi:hypothetical protein
VDFGHRLSYIGAEHEPAGAGHGVEGAILEPQMLGVHLVKLDALETGLARPLRGRRQHLRREVDGDHPAARAHPCGSRQGGLAGSTPDVEHPAAWADRGGATEPVGQRLEIRLVPGRPRMPAAGRCVPLALLLILDFFGCGHRLQGRGQWG